VSYDQTLAVVAKVRHVESPNYGFAGQLREFEARGWSWMRCLFKEAKAEATSAGGGTHPTEG